jgi:Flp pilus assembly protein TadG
MDPTVTRSVTPANVERGGATSVQMALVWAAMLAFILATVQVGLMYLAGQLALTAAQDGLRAGRYQRTASAERAHQVAEDFLSRAAGTTLLSPRVTAAMLGDGTVLQVDVTGRVLSVVPGVELHVAKRAAGAVERAAP